MTRHNRLVLALLFAAACGSALAPDTTHTKAKPDPFIAVRTTNAMDTTVAPGRAHWHVYVILTGQTASQNGVSYQGAVSIVDRRLGHDIVCSFVGADSVGQRIFEVLAVADTTTEALTPDSTAKGIANRWFAGDTVLPAGWKALHNTPADAWDSEQYRAGHGLTPDDPIKWNLTWSGAGSVTFTERPASDTGPC